MIVATPALSSEPSSVVPSVVMMSSPIISASTGCCATTMTWVGSLRQHDVATLVVPMDDRADVRAGHRGRRIDVGDEVR